MSQACYKGLPKMHDINVNFLLVKELIMPCIEIFQLFLPLSNTSRKAEKNICVKKKIPLNGNVFHN